MKINLVSWNTFGNCISKISENYSNLMCKDHDCANILLIQEAGAGTPDDEIITFASTSRDDFIFWCNSQKPTGASNDRCTTSILRQINIDGTFSSHTVSFQRKEGSKTITASRPMLILQCAGINIATIHAIACDRISPAEIKQAYDYLSGLGTEFILMGDFNCTPTLLESQGINRRNIKYPPAPTQRSGRILDFALVSNGFPAVNVKSGFPRSSGYASLSSDHIPVFVQFEI